MTPSPYPLVKHVESASEAEINQISAVLENAFEGDPFTPVLVGGDLRFVFSQLQANVRAALLGGQLDVVSIGPNVEDIVGVAIWYPPGKSAFATEDIREASGWNKFLLEIPTPLRDWWVKEYIPSMLKLSENALGRTFALNAYHLHIFGVKKEYQGRGYGRKMYEFVKAQAIKDRSPLVLEATTDVDVKIYSKLGFRICGDTTVQNWIGAGHVRLMVEGDCWTHNVRVTGEAVLHEDG